MTRRGAEVAAAYLTAQAVVGLVWLGAVAIAPSVRGWIELMPDRREGLNSFVVAGLVLFVGGSAVSAWGVWRRTEWAPIAAAFTAGGVSYATFYLAAWVLLAGTAGAGLVPMTLATVATTSIAVTVWRAVPRITST